MSTAIRIRNLPSTHTEEAVLRLCASFGEVVEYKPVAADSSIVEVRFEEKEDAQDAAANIEGMEFDGNYLRSFVVHA